MEKYTDPRNQCGTEQPMKQCDLQRSADEQNRKHAAEFLVISAFQETKQYRQAVEMVMGAIAHDQSVLHERIVNLLK